MKTIEEMTVAINGVIDKYEQGEMLINDDTLAQMRKEIDDYIKDAIEAGVIKTAPTVTIQMDELHGYMDVYVGAVNEESKDDTQDSQECEQTTQTSGESLKRVIS